VPWSTIPIPIAGWASDTASLRLYFIWHGPVVLKTTTSVAATLVRLNQTSVTMIDSLRHWSTVKYQTSSSQMTHWNWVFWGGRAPQQAFTADEVSSPCFVCTMPPLSLPWTQMKCLRHVSSALCRHSACLGWMALIPGVIEKSSPGARSLPPSCCKK